MYSRVIKNPRQATAAGAAPTRPSSYVMATDTGWVESWLDGMDTLYGAPGCACRLLRDGRRCRGRAARRFSGSGSP